MMKVQELRIGNYVYCQDEINVIYGITKEGFIKYEKENSVYYCGIDEIKPIELTEEILLKCGFFYDSDADTFKISNCTIQLDSYGFDGYMVIIFGEDLRLIKNLHQLQNIYWCLCEKELEIQL